jgi:hypothetical protein
MVGLHTTIIGLHSIVLVGLHTTIIGIHFTIMSRLHTTIIGLHSIFIGLLSTIGLIIVVSLLLKIERFIYLWVKSIVNRFYK